MQEVLKNVGLSSPEFSVKDIAINHYYLWTCVIWTPRGQPIDDQGVLSFYVSLST